MQTKRAHAFTLPELLIVIAIIGVLAALIFVSMQNAFLLSQRTTCLNNLHALHQAVKMRQSDSLSSQRPEMKVTHWATHWGVLPYVDFDRDILVCPAHGATENRVNDEDYDQEWDLATLGDWAGIDEQAENVLRDDPYESVDISELVAVKTVGSQTWITDLKPGPWCLKLSPAQYEDAWGGRSGRSRHGTNIRNKIGPYDGAGGDTTWYCIEDYGGDADFKDIRIRVTDNGDGTFDLQCHMPAVGHTNSLVSKPDHETLVQGPINGKTVTVGEVEEETEQAVGGFESVANPYGGGSRIGSDASLTFVTNYGLNAQSAIFRENSRYMSDEPGRILLLDYYKPLAMAADAWNGTELDPNQDGVPIFARHNHRVNVVFNNGAVKTLHPIEVNPATPSVQLQYWGP
jgi:prepilin-type N-terminal cleavage/methylation domain-containing protein